MKIFLLLVLFLGWLKLGLAEESTYDWTNLEGKSIQATFVKIDGDMLRIGLNDREFDYPLSKLTPESQLLAKKLSTAQVERALSQPFDSNATHLPGVIVLSDVSGEVKIRVNGKFDAKGQPVLLPLEQVKPGLAIMAGHAIYVGKTEGSSARLFFSNGTIVKLAVDSRLNLKRFTQDKFEASDRKLHELSAEPSISHTELALELGAAAFDLVELNPQSSFAVTSPLGATFVTETRASFMINLRPGFGDGWHSACKVYRGALSFRSKRLTPLPPSPQSNEPNGGRANFIGLTIAQPMIMMSTGLSSSTAQSPPEPHRNTQRPSPPALGASTPVEVSAGQYIEPRVNQAGNITISPPQAFQGKSSFLDVRTPESLGPSEPATLSALTLAVRDMKANKSGSLVLKEKQSIVASDSSTRPPGPPDPQKSGEEQTETTSEVTDGDGRLSSTVDPATKSPDAEDSSQSLDKATQVHQPLGEQGKQNPLQLAADQAFSNVAFNTPETIPFGEPSYIHFVLNPSLGKKELSEQVEEAGSVETARIKITQEMEVTLKGDDFAITPITSEKQMIALDETTEWKWSIVPKRPGKHRVHLVVHAIIRKDGEEMKRSKSFESYIEIEVTGFQQVVLFMQDNWPWLALGFVPLALFVPVRASKFWKNRRAAKHLSVTRHEEGQPIDVFVSYSSHDRAVVLPLVESLRAFGYNVWVDQSGIHGASQWSEQIVAAIEAASSFILLSSSHSFASHNVVKEASLASEQRKHLVPVFIEEVEVPQALQYQLAGLQRVNYSDQNHDESMQSIVEALTKLGVVGSLESD